MENISSHEFMIMSDVVDDPLGVWECVWLFRGKSPEASMSDLVSLSQIVLRQLMARGWVCIISRIRPAGDLNPLEPTDLGEIFYENTDIAKYWEPPPFSSIEYVVDITEQGERAYFGK